MDAKKKKLSNLKIKQQALYIFIFTFVTVVVWIGGSLFRSQRRTGIAPSLLELAKPLSPTVNEEVITVMEQSPYYDANELAQFQIFKLIKSKDGRVQQVVPIDSELNEIPDNQVELFTTQNSADARLSNQTNLGEQVDSGSGTFAPNLGEIEAEQSQSEPSSDTTETTQPSQEEEPSVQQSTNEDGFVQPAPTGYFGEDGRYYLD